MDVYQTVTLGDRRDNSCCTRCIIGGTDGPGSRDGSGDLGGLRKYGDHSVVVGPMSVRATRLPLP